MDEKKIPCGGFRVGDGLSIDGDVLKATGEGAVQSDYDENDETSLAYIKNRHGGYNKPRIEIEWDGKDEGRTIVNSQEVTIQNETYISPIEFIKISDTPIEWEDMEQATLTISMKDGSTIIETGGEDYRTEAKMACIRRDDAYVLSAYSPEARLDWYNAGRDFVFKFVSVGTYFSRITTKSNAYRPYSIYSEFAQKFVGSPLPVPFDESFIPDSIARKDEVISESDIYADGVNTIVIEWDGKTEGKDTFTIGSNTYCKVSDKVVAFDSLGICSFECLIGGVIPRNLSGDQYKGTSCYAPVGTYDSVIVVTQAGECKIGASYNVADSSLHQYTFTAPSTGIYFYYGGSTTTGYKYTQNSITERVGIKINSSSKKWKIVVDDSGKISAVEDNE